MIFKDLSKEEFKKILPMTLLLFCLCVSYCIMRNLKDTITLTANGAGAEVYPFIKFWGMLPAAILFTSLFAYLSRHLKKAALFYVMLSGFLGYYLLFAFVIYPNYENLQLTRFSASLKTLFPSGSRGLIEMIQNWPITMFYILSDLWSTMMINILFWGYANEVTTPKEAGRYFGIIKIGATASALAAGLLASQLTLKEFNPSFPLGNTPWEQTLYKQVLTVAVLGLASMVLFHWLNRHHFLAYSKEQKKQKIKMSLFKSINYVRKSRYLTCICIAVVGYNLVFNLVDLLWKHEVRNAFSDPNEMMAYMNWITMSVGLISVVAVLSIRTIVQRFGWTLLASITPIVMLLFAGLFFSVALYSDSLRPLFLSIGTSPVIVLLTIGAFQNFSTKAAKYSVFDISKEMAFTALEDEQKWYGKTAIDGVGNDVGVTGASFLNQWLLVLSGSIAATTPIIALLVIGFLLIWIAAVKVAGTEYEERAELLPSQ